MFTAFEFSCDSKVCDRSVSVNVTMNTFDGLKFLTETKIQMLYNHVDQTRFHIFEMGCQLLFVYIVGLTIFINFTSAVSVKQIKFSLNTLSV